LVSTFRQKNPTQKKKSQYSPKGEQQNESIDGEKAIELEQGESMDGEMDIELEQGESVDGETVIELQKGESVDGETVIGQFNEAGLLE